ncbi:MAG: FAD-dependent oxidoreductase [Anaerolineales bacterium]|nr:FAD-dependent oxidoreductase [Anaerolineales bacterium]
MEFGNDSKHVVAVIGAGPAGLFAARQLASSGAAVVIFNRDIKPGGLAEYGIYPAKVRMKEGLRKQFRQILEMPGIRYYGNVKIGRSGDLTLDDVRGLGFQAVLVTVGAQGTKWLGLPGEDTPLGVYHAKDLVYNYNKLPPFTQKEFHFGNRIALVGVGNVMTDIARYCIRELKVDEVIAVARRGPAEVKFDKKEMEYIVANLDQDALNEEIARVAPIMTAIGQDPQAARDYILSALPKAVEPVSATRFKFDFLASPTRILGDENGQVRGLEVMDTTLVLDGSDTRAKSLGTSHTLDADTVIFCIGDKVDEEFGLPVQWNEYVKNPDPLFPVDNLSYEAYDPEKGQPIPGVFVAGWSREASSGLVGIARKDGERGAAAALQYLQGVPPIDDPAALLARVQARLDKIDKPLITKDYLPALEQAELAEAARLGLEDFKFSTNEEMLKIMELA